MGGAGAIESTRERRDPHPAPRRGGNRTSTFGTHRGVRSLAGKGPATKRPGAAVASGAEMSGYLVGSAAFKAVGTGDPRPAGSIPVHLRQERPGRNLNGSAQGVSLGISLENLAR